MIEFVKLYFTDVNTFVVGNLMIVMILFAIMYLRYIKESLK